MRLDREKVGVLRFHTGSLGYGASVSTELVIAVSGTPSTSPVEIELDPGTTGEYFDGWGGNFVFCTAGGEIDYLLSNLRVAWARTEMSLRDWEPRNDDCSPKSFNWSYYESKVPAGGTLDLEFKLACRLNEFDWTPAVDLDEFDGILQACSQRAVAATALLSYPKQLATLPVALVLDNRCPSE